MKWSLALVGGAFTTALSLPISQQFAPKEEDGWMPLAPAHARGNEMPPKEPPIIRPSAEYREAVQRTAEMVSDNDAQRLAGKYGLQILNLTWEDTGRYKNSAVGPNISDMTIQVELKDPKGPSEVRCMPVIRKPNFSDVSTDIDPHDFTLLVGNQHGGGLRRVSLYDFLDHPTSFLTKPRSWLGHKQSLLAPRDSKVLVSAQACFLPVPKQGLATFNPVLFNYISTSGDPGVLTILATREGSSTTVIDNKRDAFSEGGAWGQRLFHNRDGMRSSLTGQRESDFNEQQSFNGGNAATPGMSMVLLIQVPLKQKHPMRDFQPMMAESVAKAAPSGGGMMAQRHSNSDVESAVIGHGADEGPFTEIDNLNIARDPNFPVRVTVQFYKATSNGVVSPGDMAEIDRQIDSVYEHGDVVGSLVTQGETGRPTEYVGCKVQPRDWWERFWQRHEQDTGDSREEAIRKLRHLLGDDYQDQPVCELYLRDLLRGR